MDGHSDTTNVNAMRVLWTVNTLMPEIAKQMGIKASHSISWVEAMSKLLKTRQDVQLAISCPSNVKHLQNNTIDNITYYVFPNDGKDYWADIINSFHPDIIHAYGTEQNHNLSLVKYHKDVPVIVSLQGILSEYQHHYYAGIDYSVMLRYSSLKSLFFKDGFFSGRRDFIRRSKIEQAILKEVKYVEGRSTWDRVSALNINPNLKYYYCPRLIRAPFYTANWDVNRIEAHSVFVHQGNYPIKGLHFVFEAISKLKKRYPDIKLYIAGNAYFKPQNLKQRLLQNGYIKYLNHLIKTLDIEQYIHFTGYLSASELACKLETTNVVVIPSSIENAPNSLVEAQLVGTPCVASFVGGNMDMVEHNHNGYLYCYNEPNMLADYISRLFDSKEIATSFSVKAKDYVREKHNPATLMETLLGIYSKVLKDNNRLG